ncbi:MAG: ornithine carbamoyltransferase [Candidatus Methanoliparum thermophilum]|uniref:Ornithine carbamoyltransferase n=1 Tax=Methanoliparum thermophilum TaxID=2491083 RepID=A0A520KSI9_METT2|nr:ornithine carbamoyltransferase [Candidatus Methanoliparum sp. LAM-1]RZN64887.1 MAG: ornithine carbamoyltransferase [Candidatus Methanoliparum thermophilum]BDC36240.1 ornithine carbamoyltransferase [Candidatus Methanoliparum sp. LAM-1]
MNVLSILDLSKKDIEEILDLAMEMKRGNEKRKFLNDKNVAMIFEKQSTRTRVSFEVAMRQLGGYAIYLNKNDLQLGRGESIQDTAKVLSRYVDGIIVRTFEHETVEEMAKYSSVPVINALTNLEHPCQSLADLFTIKEFKGDLKGLKLVWIGDVNNVCNSLILISSLFGINISIGSPRDYGPSRYILDKLDGHIKYYNDPYKAAEDADIIYTDVWVSMGNEDEKDKREIDFKEFQVNQKLLSHAKKDAIVMHCLPAIRGKEITSDVMDGKNSVIFDQAENRLHTQKALLAKVIR